MSFETKVTEMIACRAAYICSNPECNTLTIGPALIGGALKDKKGEIAHIIGERPGAARFTSNPSINVDSVENGLQLYANYHTLTDKNSGIDCTESKLFEWEKKHEDSISVLLGTCKSPLPLISRQSTSCKITQSIVDCISSRGAYFRHSSIENPIFTISSIDQVRETIQRKMKNADTDKHLREICREVQDTNGKFMNELSSGSSMFDAHLSMLHKKAGRQLRGLRDGIGCDVVNQITTIIP